MRLLPASSLWLIALLTTAPVAAQAGGLGAPIVTPPPAPVEPSPAPEAPPAFEVRPPAAAVCTDGRVASAATQGRCCWPQQSFSVERARCEGAPQCPWGRSAHGDDCVPPPSLVAPASVPPGPTQAIGATDAPQRRPFGGVESETAMRHGLVGAGVTVLLAGYVAAATYGPILSSAGCDGTGLFWFVPLAGPLLGSAMQRCYSSSYYYSGTTGADTADWVMTAATTALQIAGLVMTIVGVADRRPIVLARGADGDALVSLELGSTPALRF